MAAQNLDPNEILSSEFNHASKMAFQADEDKVRVFSYYLATAGTLIATLILGDLNNNFHLFIFGVLFAGLAVLGIMSLLKLAKLRLAWIDSIRTMHRIKSYYIQNNADLEKAFRWTDKTIPSPGKKWTVAFLMAVTISFLSSFSVGGAVFFLGLAINSEFLIMPSLFLSLFVFIGQLLLWCRLCPNKS